MRVVIEHSGSARRELFLVSFLVLLGLVTVAVLLIPALAG